MHTETTTPATTPSTRNRRAPKRPEQLDAATAAAAETLAATTAEAKPAVQLSDEQRARIEKERAKLEKEEKAAERRKARLAALERGEDLPASTKGLPQVTKMNDLGALARRVHRALVLATSEEVQELLVSGRVDIDDNATMNKVLRAGRDEAVRQWRAQYQQRVDAGAADNETLYPLGLEDDGAGDLRLVEKSKAEGNTAE